MTDGGSQRETGQNRNRSGPKGERRKKRKKGKKGQGLEQDHSTKLSRQMSWTKSTTFAFETQ